MCGLVRRENATDIDESIRCFRSRYLKDAFARGGHDRVAVDNIVLCICLIKSLVKRAPSAMLERNTVVYSCNVGQILDKYLLRNSTKLLVVSPELYRSIPQFQLFRQNLLTLLS